MPDETTVVKDDITDKESMLEAMAGVDGVFHIAGWAYIGPGRDNVDKAERVTTPPGGFESETLEFLSGNSVRDNSKPNANSVSTTVGSKTDWQTTSSGNRATRRNLVS